MAEKTDESLLLALRVIDRLTRERPGEAEREYRDDSGEYLCGVCGGRLGGVDGVVLPCGVWAHPACMPSKAPDPAPSIDSREVVESVLGLLRANPEIGRAMEAEQKRHPENWRERLEAMVAAVRRHWPASPDSDDDVPF